MGPARIVLVRHAEAAMPDEHGRVYSYGDAPLTPRGREQAARLGRLLAPLPIDAAYCSDLVRARETAELVLRDRGIAVRADARLREVDVGALEGFTIERLRAEAPQFAPWLETAFEGRFSADGSEVPASLVFPQGESVELGLARVLPLFLEIARTHQDRTVVLVSHRRLVQALLGYVTEAGAENYHRFGVANAGLTMIEVGPDGRGVLCALNSDLDLRESVERARGDGGRGTTRVVFVRHGHAMSVEKGGPAYSHNPIPLSAVGREQAECVAAALSNVHIDALYSSDLVRARETAEICGRAIGIDVVVDEALREVALGDFEGMTLERVHAEHPPFAPWLEVTFRARFPSAEFHHPADLRFPNGQSVLQVHDVALAGFRRIIEAHVGKTVVLVSHGWVLQPLLCHVVGADPRSYFRFSLPTATVSFGEVERTGRGVLEIFNAAIDLERLPKLTTMSRDAEAAHS